LICDKIRGVLCVIFYSFKKEEKKKKWEMGKEGHLSGYDLDIIDGY